MTIAQGRNVISSRATVRVVSALAAETFGVSARAVRVDLSDRDGLLAVRVRTPIRFVALDGVGEPGSAPNPNSGTVLQRAATAQATIRDRATELTGAGISHVTVELTGIDIRKERRVV